ncbi:hypothetical protein [Amorphus sp. 3PC139-8]|uniref:hypothetical protein n=1 Tax=Amorphus sp. 3PC139-8 TaxID=2735676 RepID=UPI00345DEA58
MTVELELSPTLHQRVAAIAARSGMTVSQVIADALENSRSLEWQEQSRRRSCGKTVTVARRLSVAFQSRSAFNGIAERL